MYWYSQNAPLKKRSADALRFFNVGLSLYSRCESAVAVVGIELLFVLVAVDGNDVGNIEGVVAYIDSLRELALEYDLARLDDLRRYDLGIHEFDAELLCLIGVPAGAAKSIPL